MARRTGEVRIHNGNQVSLRTLRLVIGSPPHHDLVAVGVLPDHLDTHLAAVIQSQRRSLAHRCDSFARAIVGRQMPAVDELYLPIER